MTFSAEFLNEVSEVARKFDVQAIERCVEYLERTRERGGRVFVLGVGGSAANASHAVNDFRKLASIEAYAPSDNVAELTARTNDEGWASTFEAWLRGSRLRSDDTVLVLSVGGGSVEPSVSPNIVSALDYARSLNCTIIGFVGRSSSYAARVADVCVIVPTVNPAHVTPHAESFQQVLWHLLVSHPRLQVAPTKWESIVP